MITLDDRRITCGENESHSRPAAISYHVEEDESGGSFSLWRSDMPGSKPAKDNSNSGGFVVCQNVNSLSFKFYDSAGRESESWDSSSFAADQKGKSPVAVKIELSLVNLNDKDNPYKFLTKVFLPVKK